MSKKSLPRSASMVMSSCPPRRTTMSPGIFWPEPLPEPSPEQVSNWILLMDAVYVNFSYYNLTTICFHEYDSNGTIGSVEGISYYKLDAGVDGTSGSGGS